MVYLLLMLICNLVVTRCQICPGNQDLNLCSHEAIDELRNEICPSEDMRMVGLQAFTTELSRNRDIANEAAILFDTTITDPGENLVLGVFRCPDDDIYAFYWSIHGSVDGVSAELVVQNEGVKYGPLTAEAYGSFSGTSSMSTILQCQEGSLVWVRGLTWPEGKECPIDTYESVFSSFTGFKIAAGDDEDSEQSAFTVELSSETTSEDIMFDRVLANIGGDFNTTTGEYVCPSDGVYVFTLSGNLRDHSRDYQIVQNDLQRCATSIFRLQGDMEDTGTATGTCILECEKNDVITVKSSTSATHAAQLTSLTGFRLYDDEDGVIAFSVKLTFDRNEYLNGQDMIFSNVITNIGGGYFPGVGFFGCQDSEYYFFTWSITVKEESSDRAGEARLVLTEDGDKETVKRGPRTIEARQDTWARTSSTQAVVQCSPGRAFNLQAVVSGGGSMVFDDFYTYFSGFRLPRL